MTVLHYVDYLSVAPAIEPVSVADAKRNSDYDDPYRDQDFARWITEARKRVEHDARLSLVNQTRIRKLDAFPGVAYLECIAPLVSVTSLAYIDQAGSTQTWASSNYEVDTARHLVWLAYEKSWPDTRDIQNAVTLTYVSGHGATAATVPEAAKDAILLYCKMRFDHPEAQMDDWTTTGSYQALIDTLKGGFYP